ncbi:hypothetical protein QQF73_05015 [Marinobacter sp. M216]|uniref:DUF502 domain-containing protein n=1 Tax=Marinobacter albus TaxID=3030833 RepID=A0ABT7H9G5_9GAMM|nr:DUF502 domain-containing protein [Marinobacter sp. M216]MDK9556978.1 hypothetical protein [Marinobacter sp. M216]
MNFIKTTIIGGIVFLLPVVVILVVLGKAHEIMLRVAEPLGRLLPIDYVGGVAVANLLALVSVLLVSFVAGFVAKGSRAKQFYRQIDNGLLAIPGYSFIKSFAENLKMDEAESRSLQSVMVHFDDYAQVGFEVERLSDGPVVVYLPGSPDPWSGSVVYVSASRVHTLEITVPQAVGHIRRLGRGAEDLRDALKMKRP